MHQQQRAARFAVPTRILSGAAFAVSLAAIIVAIVDPTEALCALYPEGHPLWYLYMCWRFSSAQNLLGG